MPRVALPPTPASSTDIQGKKKPKLMSLEMSFALPPPAIAPAGSNLSPSDSANSAYDSSYRPESSVSPAVKANERPSDRASSSQQPSSNATTSELSLPPPPTRSRKIIQMKPGSQPAVLSNGNIMSPYPRASGKKGGDAHTVTSSPGSRKRPSATSAAGRKVARKTAHSLIERRRRSKMNEEFGVLKDMIPACKDQEMHKLAILSASIDYLRYLEQCVTDLKKANGNVPMRCQTPTARRDSLSPDIEDEDENDDHNRDSSVEMANTDSTEPSPAITSYTSNVSTFLPAINPSNRQNSTSTISSLSSPAFKPQTYQYQAYEPQYADSTKTSLTIKPNAMEDQEVTAVLLMLNQERRGITSSSETSKRMSVKDLLSPE